MSVRKQPVAYLALFIALGGTAYAASSLPPDSVGTRALKDGAVTDAKVREHSLGARVFAAGALPTLRTEVMIAPQPTCSPYGCSAQVGESVSLTAPCPSGTQVVGGGYSNPPGSATEEVATTSEPVAAGWEVTFTFTQSSPSGFVPGYGSVYAVCASVG